MNVFYPKVKFIENMHIYSGVLTFRTDNKLLFTRILFLTINYSYCKVIHIFDYVLSTNRINFSKTKIFFNSNYFYGKNYFNSSFESNLYTSNNLYIYILSRNVVFIF